MQPSPPTIGGVPGQTLGAPSVKIAVGDKCAINRYADLTAMCMSRNDQVVPVGGHRVEDAPIRRMGYAESKINLSAINRACDIGITILINMRVVGATETNSYALDL